MVKAFPAKLSEIGEKMEKVKLIYGTTNAGKVELMRRYLRRLKGVEIVGLGELPQTVLEPEEGGADPMENAKRKALHYYRALQRPVFSEDSGLYIQGLPKEEQPGVFVRRVGGRTLTDEEIRAHYKGIAKRLGGKCLAEYRNAICLVFSEKEVYLSREEDVAWEKFWLTQEERPQRTAGFPLDAISEEYPSGRHFYDRPEGTPIEGDGAGVLRFFREALAAHGKRERNKP